MTTKRPNILFIMADQMAAPMLPMYNPESVVQMPHLSRLASEGVVFESAYCPSPLCAPSRFSLVSGQLPSKIGAYDNSFSPTRNASSISAKSAPTPSISKLR